LLQFHFRVGLSSQVLVPCLVGRFSISSVFRFWLWHLIAVAVGIPRSAFRSCRQDSRACWGWSTPFSFLLVRAFSAAVFDGCSPDRDLLTVFSSQVKRTGQKICLPVLFLALTLVTGSARSGAGFLFTPCSGPVQLPQG
jgi:hypothetical protein